MSFPNIGPDQFDEGCSDQADSSRRGNPPPALRDEPLTDDVVAATARASTVTHRFGGVRYALTRPIPHPEPPTEEGDSDARQ
jgi:hypothetical protein